MATLTCNTAGESHGPALIVLLNGLPAQLPLDIELINHELKRRLGGFGRGGRQKIEQDTVEILSGVRLGRTIGAPIALQIHNRDSRLDDLERTPPVHRPRPGHADLAGAIKRLTTDCRETLERASARETAARVAGGALTRSLLREFGIRIVGFVRSIQDVVWEGDVDESNLEALIAARDASEVYCPDADASEQMIQRIRQAKVDKDTVGGLVEAHVVGCPIGLGSSANWYDKLDARLAQAVMGIQAFKAVEIGLGKETARRPGSLVHDPIHYDPARAGETSLGFVRPSNNAGGLEGGMTNGQPIVVRGAMKPISTL
ncbi:MAG: chorismate synthase, partial [Phycisphaerales bacterium JB038]